MTESFYLNVSDGHALHIACYGTPHGRPVLFLHGGPGSGCNEGQKAIFDPKVHFAIFMDQRGAGKSLPQGSRHANTTNDLINDIEQLRQYLKIDHWAVVGGSWGATLALAYAQAHPDRVNALILRAIFLGTQEELNWAFDTALRTFFPNLYQGLIEHLSVAERDAPLHAYWRRILDPNPDIHAPATWIWYDVERALSNIAVAYDRLPARDLNMSLPKTPVMEAHYFSHDCFLAPNELFNNLGRIAHIPAALIQARYDLLCPPITSARLAQNWPAAQLILAEHSGHSISHTNVLAAMQRAITDLV